MGEVMTIPADIIEKARKCIPAKMIWFRTETETNVAAALADERVSSGKEIEKLKEALRPFAVIGDVLSKQSPSDDSPWTRIPDNQSISVGWEHLTVTAGDLRRAAAAVGDEG
jgi:hypothetical protein